MCGSLSSSDMFPDCLCHGVKVSCRCTRARGVPQHPPHATHAHVHTASRSQHFLHGFIFHTWVLYNVSCNMSHSISHKEVMTIIFLFHIPNTRRPVQIPGLYRELASTMPYPTTYCQQCTQNYLQLYTHYTGFIVPTLTNSQPKILTFVQVGIALNNYISAV